MANVDGYFGSSCWNSFNIFFFNPYCGMVRKIWVRSQVTSYQRLLKWYLLPHCLTLSNIRYVSRVKWSNSGKGAAPSPTPQCSSYWKGSLLVVLDYSRQLYFTIVGFLWITLSLHILLLPIISPRLFGRQLDRVSSS